MNVFADLHHSGLYFSLHLFFEKRLGWNLYRPVGIEWFTKDFWDIAKPYNNNLDTIKQYLSLDQRFQPIDGTLPLNILSSIQPTHYEIEDLAHEFTEKAITFEQFLNMDIDFIVASIPDHWITYTRLRDQYKPKAKVICQMGNMFNECIPYIEQGIVKNLMASTISFDLPLNINAVFYHQEQPLYNSCKSGVRAVRSFVHLLPRPDLFETYSKNVREYKWYSYGAGCPDGNINGLINVYQAMENSSWIYHVKPGGDGYGWVWHSAFMIGRPVITNYFDYQDKLGGLLFEDGVTGLDLERHTVKENCDFLRTADILTMGKKARERFFAVVNYDEEEKTLQRFLGEASL